MFTHFFIVFFVTFLLSFLLGRLNISKTYDLELLSAYECGFNPFSDTRSAFDVKFYLVAIFFIIFDLEIIFFFPFVVCLPDLNFFQFSIIIFFAFQLLLGLIYEYFFGTLD
jgi:NADH-quinone oxidoreductase subunit A